MKLPNLIKKFLTFCSIERHLSDNTLLAYSYDLADFRRWLPAKSRSQPITTDILRAYLENMRLERVQSTATIRRRLACLRSFFRYLHDEGLSSDPFVGWRLKLARRKRLPRALSGDETAALLASAGFSPARRRSRLNERIEVALMIATGIRVGELCKLDLEDISQDAASLRIRGKGSRDRVVYVTNPELRRALRRRVQDRRRLSGKGALFLNQRGSRLTPHAFRSQLAGIARQANSKRRITPHMLRHTAATLLIERGVDIRIVQRLLGHSSIATTEIYTHVSDEALRRTLERANVIGSLAA
ncbi:tyrosine-type recombinase/integrase [Bradyrhizobium sp. USDA 4451]